MFELFGRNKKKNDKDMEISIASGIRTDQFVQQMTKQADIEFAKPKYNPETRKMYYDNGASHRQAKENAFSQEGVVRDPYTGAELVHTVQEAKMRFGNDWQEHLAEADHIDPLNQIVKRVEDNPWIATRDVKSIGNDQENFQVISRRMNQTGGKGGSTQREWSQDYEQMKKISEQTGEPIEDIAERIRQVGDTAEKRNNMKLAQAGIKNATTTFHSAGKVGATNSASTAATISSIYNIASCINGENTVADAFRNVSQDASRAAISGYIKTGSLTVLNHTLTSSNSEFLVTLGKKNVPGKVVNMVSVAGKTVVKWGNGEISAGECLVELGDKGCCFYGQKIGGAIGDSLVPGIGGVVGSLIGGELTRVVYGSIIQEIEEERRRKEREVYEAMMKYYLEQQRRKEVHELIKANTENAVICSVQSIIQNGTLQNLMNNAQEYFDNRIESERRIAECILVTLQLQEYRKQLQEYVDNYFVGYEECFSLILEEIDSSLKMNDYDGAIASVNQVSKMFGRTSVIENTEDFVKKFFGDENISF